MLRLETIEDFERIGRALKNPNSTFTEYFVQPFGYCLICVRVTGFKPATTVTGVPNFSLAVECLSCGSNFEVPGTGGGVSTGAYIAQDSEARLSNSRDHQARLFRIALEVKIKDLKKQEREAKSSVRRLARLR